MNTWEKRKIAIVEADDFQDKYDRNGLEMLFYWKAKYPKFKITLFTIPNKTSKGMFQLMSKHLDWIEFAVHGWDHDSNFECWGWDYEKAKVLLNRARNINYRDYDTVSELPIHGTNLGTPFSFKAPGWMITDKYGGYDASPELPIAKDPQCVYKALMDMNFLVFDRHYNKPARPEGLNCVCVDCNPDIVHMHTWDMVTGDLQGKNGFKQVEELHGVPWDNETEFYLVGEALKEGLLKPCKNN